MRKLALALILFYRRFISPYKGFACAYRCHTGRSSCSSYGYRAVRRFGVVAGIKLIRRRLSACGEIYRGHLRAPPQAMNDLRWRRQAGFCDAGCDVGGCDGPNLGSCACDGISGCGSCDLPDWKWRKRGNGGYVEIEPNSMIDSSKSDRK